MRGGLALPRRRRGRRDEGGDAAAHVPVSRGRRGGRDALRVEDATAQYGGATAELPPPADAFLPLVVGGSRSRRSAGRGATVAAEARAPPAEPLVLYSYDGNQFCRLVREVMAELDLPYRLRSTGKGSPRRQELLEVAGATTAPYLVDPNTGASMGESADICAYLLRTYAD